MAITAGVAIKTLVAAGILGLGATGFYYTKEYLSNGFSKYDLALVNFLVADEDNDIVFEIKKGAEANQDLAETDIAFTNGTEKSVSLSAVVQVSSTSTTAFKKKGGTAPDSNDEAMKKIKELNKGSWTWRCTLTFTKDDKITDTNPTIKHKERIYGANNKGLFGILKKDLTSYNYDKNEENKWTKQELKKIKKDFIVLCGYSRGLSKNKEINNAEDADNKVIDSQAQTFIFDKKDGNEITLNNMDKFDVWFEERYKNKEYGTVAAA